MEYISRSEAETEDLGRRLAAVLPAGSVIACLGGLGYRGRVTSPTFTIVNEYRGGRFPLFHMDLYRLNGPDDLWDIGWEDYLDQGGITLVEWSERALDAMPEGTVRVSIAHCPEHEDWRTITMEGAEPL